MLLCLIEAAINITLPQASLVMRIVCSLTRCHWNIWSSCWSQNICHYLTSTIIAIVIVRSSVVGRLIRYVLIDIRHILVVKIRRCLSMVRVLLWLVIVIVIKIVFIDQILGAHWIRSCMVSGIVIWFNQLWLSFNDRLLRHLAHYRMGLSLRLGLLMWIFWLNLISLLMMLAIFELVFRL